MQPLDPTVQEFENLLRLLASREEPVVHLGMVLLEELEITKELITTFGISKLLLHPNGRIVRLTLDWIEKLDLGAQFIADLFLLYKCTGNKKTKRKARLLLNKHASLELKTKLSSKKILTRANPRSTSPAEATLSRNITFYTENCEIEGRNLAYLLYQKYKVGINYLLTVGSTEDRTQFLANLIKENRLTIVGKKLREFPPDIFEFPELIELDLSNNLIKIIPDEIIKLKKLQVLRLDHNNLQHLNPKLIALKNLEALSIGYNSFISYPNSLSKLVQLEKLNIERLSKGRFYISIPRHFQQLRQLKELRMAGDNYKSSCYTQKYDYPFVRLVNGNPIDLTPLALAEAAYWQNKGMDGIDYIFRYGTEEMIYKILENLYDKHNASLDLSKIYLKEIPERITQFAIKDLNLAHTFQANAGKNKGIEHIGNLVDLERLDLRFNALQELPSNFGNLNKLKYLNLNCNSFAVIPEVIFELENLEELEIENANLFYRSEIDNQPFDQFVRLKKLQHVRFRCFKSDREQVILKYTNWFSQLLPNCIVTFEEL